PASPVQRDGLGALAAGQSPGHGPGPRVGGLGLLADSAARGPAAAKARTDDPARGDRGGRVRPPYALWRLSVLTSREAEEAVAEVLRNWFGHEPCSYMEAETGTAAVAVYLESRPDWSRTTRASLRASLARLRGCGLDTGAGRLSLARVRRQNWAESW